MLMVLQLRPITPTSDGDRAEKPDSGQSREEVELSVVMPCLNEGETLACCIDKAQQAMREHGIRGEVIVADNGSTDGSAEIARLLGARIVEVPEKGYGSALMGGISAARGKYVIMGDADDSYDFLHIPRFIEKLRAGHDLVMGNRFQGGIAPGAMPASHRYLGNPILSGMGRLFFGSPCGDFHCGLRGFRKKAIIGLELRTTGMEFATEMVVKATLQGLSIGEVPTTLSPDGRHRPPHLRTWRDGWRHLRFLLMYSPRWLFLYPGLALMCCGAAVAVWLLPGPRQLGPLTLDVHTLLYACVAILVGFQAVWFAVLTKVFATGVGLLPPDARLQRAFGVFTLESGLLVGAVLILAGVVASVLAVWIWGSRAFGPLEPGETLRLVIPAVLAAALGCQVVLSSFFLSILGLHRK
jgi:hypothetical protein